jgi:Xaa-Pro aminopeptidase
MAQLYEYRWQKRNNHYGTTAGRYNMPNIDRLSTLQRKLSHKAITCAILFYSRDVFYYTGTAQPAYLVVTPHDYCLYVKSGIEFALQEVFIKKEKIREERRLENIYHEISSLLGKHSRVAIEMDVLPAAQLLKFKKLFTDCEFIDASPLALEQRKIKDRQEISRIRHACEVIDSGHRAVLSTLRDGVTELELAAAVENAHRLAGHEGIFFIRHPDFFMSRGPISSGSNLFRISGVVYTITGVGLSPSVPAGPSRRKILKGEPVIIDIPTLVEGYHADQTRTYILGKANERIRSMHAKLKEIADDLIERIKPEMVCSDIYTLALKKAEQLNVSNIFMNFGNGRISQLIGHGVGIELNEPPSIAPYERSLIPQGSVIALDIHMLEENVGVVKLEDMILVKSNGNEILNHTDRKLFEI